MAIKLKCCQQILIVLFEALKLKMFIKTSTKIKIYLTSVIIKKNSKYYNNINNLVIGKMKDETFRMS